MGYIFLVDFPTFHEGSVGVDPSEIARPRFGQPLRRNVGEEGVFLGIHHVLINIVLRGKDAVDRVHSFNDFRRTSRAPQDSVKSHILEGFNHLEFVDIPVPAPNICGADQTIEAIRERRVLFDFFVKGYVKSDFLSVFLISFALSDISSLVEIDESQNAVVSELIFRGVPNGGKREGF